MKKKVIFSFAFTLLTFVGIAQEAATSSKKPALETAQTQEISTNSTESKTIVSSDKKAVITTDTEQKGKEQNPTTQPEQEEVTGQRKKPE